MKEIQSELVLEKESLALRLKEAQGSQRTDLEQTFADLEHLRAQKQMEFRGMEHAVKSAVKARPFQQRTRARREQLLH